MSPEEIEVGMTLHWEPGGGQVIPVVVEKEPWAVQGGSKIVGDPQDATYPSVADGPTFFCRVRLPLGKSKDVQVQQLSIPPGK